MLSFTVAGHDAGSVEKALDADGIEVRAGNLAAAPLLRALGTEKAVRASFMFYNRRDEADALAASLRRLIRGG